MRIDKVRFVKGIVGTDPLLEDGIPQVAFIGRSNVGKSSLINSLTGVRGLAKSSSTPGKTQEMNAYLINNKTYFLDLPGYGFAKGARAGRERFQKIINWYLFESDYEQRKVVLIVDANVGLTQDDQDMLASLEHVNKNIVIVANKVDKIKASEYEAKIQRVRDACEPHKVWLYSSDKKIGVGELSDELLK